MVWETSISHEIRILRLGLEESFGRMRDCLSANAEMSALAKTAATQSVNFRAGKLFTLCCHSLQVDGGMGSSTLQFPRRAWYRQRIRRGSVSQTFVGVTPRGRPFQRADTGVCPYINGFVENLIEPLPTIPIT